MSGRAVALTLRDVRIAKIARMQKRARCLNELDNYLSAVDVIGSPTRYDLNNTASHLRNLADGMKGKKKDVSMVLT